MQKQYSFKVSRLRVIIHTNFSLVEGFNKFTPSFDLRNPVLCQSKNNPATTIQHQTNSIPFSYWIWINYRNTDSDLAPFKHSDSRSPYMHPLSTSGLSQTHLLCAQNSIATSNVLVTTHSTTQGTTP